MHKNEGRVFEAPSHIHGMGIFARRDFARVSRSLRSMTLTQLPSTPSAPMSLGNTSTTTISAPAGSFAWDRSSTPTAAATSTPTPRPSTVYSTGSLAETSDPARKSPATIASMLGSGNRGSVAAAVTTPSTVSYTTSSRFLAISKWSICLCWTTGSLRRTRT